MRAADVDVAVVGLGLIGSGALRHLAVAGADVVGVGPGEPVDLGTHRGAFASHYDSGRITRRLDPRREWAVLAGRAIAGYAALEAASGIAFHRPVGVVLAERDEDRIASTLANAAAMDVPVTVVARGTPSPFGDLLAFPPRSVLLCEPSPAGHLDPRRMLAANLAVARTEGATVVADEVTAIEPAGAGWLLRASASSPIVARQVLVTAGPHADELLAGVIDPGSAPDLAVRGETVVLATVDDAEQQRLGAMPAVLARIDHPTYADLYVVPPTTYPDGSVRLKLGATRTDHRLLRTPEEKRAWMRGGEHGSELVELRGLLEDLVPGLQASSWETKPCLITETPSGLPYLEHLAPDLVIAAGGNGFAAKSANAIGALAADLLVAGTWSDPELESVSFGR